MSSWTNLMYSCLHEPIWWTHVIMNQFDHVFHKPIWYTHVFHKPIWWTHVLHKPIWCTYVFHKPIWWTHVLHKPIWCTYVFRKPIWWTDLCLSQTNLTYSCLHEPILCTHVFMNQFDVLMSLWTNFNVNSGILLFYPIFHFFSKIFIIYCSNKIRYLYFYCDLMIISPLVFLNPAIISIWSIKLVLKYCLIWQTKFFHDSCDS